jgi:hypothetical protein
MILQRVRTSYCEMASLPSLLLLLLGLRTSVDHAQEQVGQHSLRTLRIRNLMTTGENQMVEKKA